MGSRIECVWSIDIFQKKDVAKNFCCLTCGDIPRQRFAYICNKDKIYCEYCIDLKLRQGMDIKLKTRMPLMVQNMILELKVKCPRYAQCKYRGTLRGLAEHEMGCQNNNKKIGVKVKECPLKYIGCTSFNGGYLNKHYDEYQQQHLDIIINYFDAKMTKMENKFQTKVSELKQENVELRDEIKEIHIAKDEISAELMNLRSQIKKINMQKQQQNDYKIVVNTPPPNALQIEEPQKSEEWNSFINAHRRLSTKTGATIPENEQNANYSNGNRLNLISQPQSFATQNSSIRSVAISEGWYHKLPNHPLIETMDNKGNKLQNESNKSSKKSSVKSLAKINKNKQKENSHLNILNVHNQSHSTQDTQTEDNTNTLINIINIDDDDDETIKTNTTNSTITNTTTTARVARINEKLKNLKQKQT